MDTSLQYSHPTEIIPETTVHINETTEYNGVKKFKFGFGTWSGLLAHLFVINSVHLILSVLLEICSCQKQHWLVWEFGWYRTGDWFYEIDPDSSNPSFQYVVLMVLYYSFFIFVFFNAFFLLIGEYCCGLFKQPSRNDYLINSELATQKRAELDFLSFQCFVIIASGLWLLFTPLGFIIGKYDFECQVDNVNIEIE